MSPNPIKGLLYSRKFLLLILDTIISLALYFGTKYASPDALADIRVVIVALQPVFVTLVGAIAYEDGKGMMANAVQPRSEQGR